MHQLKLFRVFGLLLPLLIADRAAAQTLDPAARHQKALAAALSRLEAQETLTSADHTALKRAAAERKLETLRVCGDPGNMPLSDINRAGYQNKIIELVAEAMGTRVSYFWRPYLERGLTRQTFDTHDCEVLLDIPFGYERILTTSPIYRTTYVLAYRNDRGLDIKNLDDPKLRDLKIGVFQTSGLRQALKSRGISSNVSLHVLSHDADLRPENQPWFQVKQVVDGKLDVAGVWGPFAGWMQKVKGAPLVVQPTNLWDDDHPMEFDLSVGLRHSDQILRYKIELALDEKKVEIEKILRDYGVPLVTCSRCFVPGDLPAHGAYTALFEAKPAAERPEVAEHQRVTRERLEAWLTDGADLNQELSNAILAVDADRVSFLLDKGADINAPDLQGYKPLHSAARHRKLAMLELLLSRKPDIEARDPDGLTPLLHAILRDHAPSVTVLAKGGANLDAPVAVGAATPLGLAIVENKFLAAMALIEAGANVSAPSGDAKLTPLMLAAGKQPLEMTMGAGRRPIEKLDPRDPGTLEIARELLQRGADVNAKSATGMTPLLLAAAHSLTPMVGLLVQSGADPTIKAPDGKSPGEIAKANGNEPVVSLLRLLEQSGNN